MLLGILDSKRIEKQLVEKLHQEIKKNSTTTGFLNEIHLT